MGGFFREVVTRTTAPLLVLDGLGRVRYVNAAAARLLPVSVRGTALAELFPAEVVARAYAFLAELVDTPQGASVHLTCPARHRDGHELVVELTGVNALEVPGIEGLVIAVTDVTAHHQAVGRMVERALADDLTGLPNRRLLEDRLGELARAGTTGALLILDLDQFKAVNDSHGHQAGDRALETIAARLLDAAPDTATVARMGGDEFVVVLPGLDLDAAVVLAETVLARVAEPISVAGAMIRVTASVGIGDLSAGDRGALRQADLAMYAAKRGGGHHVTTYLDGVGQAIDLALSGEVDQLRERNSELERLALTDPLTGLPNRRALDDDIVRVHAAALRSGRPWSAIYVDLDRFGSVNKTRGDDVGDAVLATVAAVLEGCCRLGDRVYRRGGEEFVAVLPETEALAASVVAERMRFRVEALALPHGGTPEQPVVTISAGVATYDARRHRMAPDVVVEANHEQIEAKLAGRNCVRPVPSPQADHAISAQSAAPPCADHAISAQSASSPQADQAALARPAEPRRPS